MFKGIQFGIGAQVMRTTGNYIHGANPQLSFAEAERCAQNVYAAAAAVAAVGQGAEQLGLIQVGMAGVAARRVLGVAGAVGVAAELALVLLNRQNGL